MQIIVFNKFMPEVLKILNNSLYLTIINQFPLKTPEKQKYKKNKTIYKTLS